ncbi:amidohydrolase family protein [Caulobacter sp. SLTY]|uniref:amidohydrolase family protein n=1 Tax=Caulobacter sp. SLTY TaxID=2683262 RepID=UPI001413523C|nr:amidohydrolase family protein [Caulobacter sp. SLTY]NBB15446.1 amidohydrolase family protein [Caulobacter sp. SLTY]
MRIDAHQHFWRLLRGDYGWLTESFGPIYRDFLPEDLRPLIAAEGISRTVLVQAAPSIAETDFLLDLAEREPLVAGVVGWTDLEAPGAADDIRRLAERPALLGLRPMIQDIPDDGWMLRPTLAPALRAMVDGGLAFDALVKPQHLANLRRFLASYPDLRVVVDHGGKPDIAGGGFPAWAEAMRTIAKESKAVCKLSGLVTEAAPGWTPEDLRPYVDVLLEAFGPARLMWGSDWPVLNLNGDYRGWLRTAEALLAGLSEAELELVFGGVAKTFYRLEL